MDPLAKNEIHLCLCDYAEIIDEHMHNLYRTLLSEEEKKQESRFYFERDRRQYLVTRALVRTVLSRYEPVEPRDWVFSVNAFGRPEIANGKIGDVCLSFNISHTHSLIALGVANGRVLGVDVENVRTRKVSIANARGLFSPIEVAGLAGVPPNRQPDHFFEYWTFKESYIKARGMGLSVPLDKFSFQYPNDGAVQLSIDPELADDPGRWQFWQFRPAPEYLVAICAERVESQSAAIVVTKTIPLGVEKNLAPAFIRTSE
jgi:4'-phosphopantetheinyl transferase